VAKREIARIWEFFRLLYPCQVVLITAAHDGKANVMSSSALPVSFKPPLLAISVSPRRFTYELIKLQGEFAVNVPPSSLLDKVALCGSISGRDLDKFRFLGLTPIKAKVVGVPLVEECIAHLECKVVKEVEAGDHVLFVGEVLVAHVDGDLLMTDEDGVIMWDLDKADVLLHVGGNIYTTAAKPLKSSVKYSFFKK